MEIRCPECGYTRIINSKLVSSDLTVATCPKCKSTFRFRSGEEDESKTLLEEKQENVQQSSSAEEVRSGEAESSEAEEQRRPVRPEDLYPPSVYSEQREEQAESSTPQPDSAQDTDPLRMVYSDGKPLDDGMPSDVPWAEVKELGFFPAISATIRGVLSKPTLFYEIMNKSGKFSIPFSFFILVSLVAVLVETVWQSVVGNPFFPAEIKPMTIDELFSILFVSPLILVIYLYSTAAILHTALKLTGAARGKIGVTLRVLCYASAADLLSVIPVVGPLVGGILKLIIIVKGLKTAHGTSYARVVPAVGFLVVLLVSFVVYTLKSQGII